MEYCKNCGQEIIFKTELCPNCKMPLEETIKDKTDNSVKLGIFAIIFGMIPLLGWIIGGIGLKKANLYNNKKGKILNIIGIFIGLISFFFNLMILM